jgi:hypothetical protein
MVNSFGGCYDPHTGTNASVERSTATSSPSTAILNSSAAQMAIFGFTAAGATLGTFTPGGSFTALTALTTNAFMYPYYQILAANTPLSTAPSWVNSVSHINLSCGFIGIPATTKNRQSNLALTGVGA